MFKAFLDRKHHGLRLFGSWRRAQQTKITSSLMRLACTHLHQGCQLSWRKQGSEGLYCRSYQHTALALEVLSQISYRPLPTSREISSSAVLGLDWASQLLQYLAHCRSHLPWSKWLHMFLSTLKEQSLMVSKLDLILPSDISQMDWWRQLISGQKKATTCSVVEGKGASTLLNTRHRLPMHLSMSYGHLTIDTANVLLWFIWTSTILQGWAFEQNFLFLLKWPQYRPLS